MNQTTRYCTVLAIISLIALHGCQSGPKGDKETQKKAISKLIKPKNKQSLQIGNKLEFDIEIAESDRSEVDSIVVFIGGKRIHKIKPGTFNWTYDTKSLNTGRVQSITKVYRKDGKTESKLANLKVLSDINPPTYGFEKIASYPHDITSYTQGLVFQNGFLYESTGTYGQSKLMKVNIQDGKAIETFDLDKKLFGEGLTLLNGELFQITWRAETAFVYDLETFKPIRTMNYAGEGWGLTHNDKQVILSNGSNELLFLNPETFKVERKLEVMDNRGPVTKLNELEYVKGEIWANYYDYKEFKIVRIDEQTGKVLSYINLTGILAAEDYHGTIDVLNGIAYDEANDRLFVTGKNYPKMYEIKILD